jgi:hypothetical protein
MAYVSVTLQHTSVNGGVAVDLFAQSWSFSWKNRIDNTPSDGAHDIVEVDKDTFENPIITIQGIIDARSSVANRATQALLMDFAQVDTSTNKIKLVLGADDRTPAFYVKGRPTAGYSVGGTYLDYLYVEIDSFSISSSTEEVSEGACVNYSLTLVESK